VVRVIAAFIIAMLVSIAIGPKFIDWLRGFATGHELREEGPAHHGKQETPIMGGLLIIVTSTLAYLLMSRYTLAGLTVLGVTLACGLVGFLDDWIKVRHRRSLGLRGRWKLGLLVAITIGVGIAAHESIHSRHPLTEIYVPGLDWWLPLAFLWYGLLFFIVAGAANGVNLTDGLDGLAAGTGMIALLTFAAIDVVGYIRSGSVGARSETDLDLAILAAALVGGTIGFLWYNAFPADVFMGDTGAMAIGGALAGFAIMTKTEVLLLLIGGIFVLVAVSVMLQVVSFKYTGRRVFLMAPIQHHFEMKGWSETKIMVRFWILAAILCAAAFALYYRYYLEFRR
jgi:phospho-N-acetylmuramoyl-pentapeptide-transferase